MLKTFDFQKKPIVDIVNEILVDSSRRGASDIHFDPREKVLLVRIRIDGILIDYAEIPNAYRDYIITRIKTISKMNITESRRPQDGAIKATIDGVYLDLRVSVLPLNIGEKIVIRILDYSRSLAGIDKLGFSEENYKKVLQMIGIPNGIILVTGATGSGKSTTLYSILQYLNRSTTNIITVEDPVEMDLEGVNQVQVNSQIGMTFAEALRSILRQDPNIIMIGEIRDSETARIAVRASITGHLVLSTIHTNNSLTTIERLIDMDVPKYLLASSLTGIISQKLARMLCPHCKVKRKTTDYEKEILKAVTGEDVEEIYDVEGCDKCNNGYKGRIAIQEVLYISSTIRDALSENADKEELRKLVYQGDVDTLLEDGLKKVILGETTFSEILNLIELDDDPNLADNISLKNVIKKTKELHTAEENAGRAVNKMDTQKITPTKPITPVQSTPKVNTTISTPNVANKTIVNSAPPTTPMTGAVKHISGVVPNKTVVTPVQNQMVNNSIQKPTNQI